MVLRGVLHRLLEHGIGEVRAPAGLQDHRFAAGAFIRRLDHLAGDLVRDDLWIQGGVVIDPRERFFQQRLTSDHKVDLGGLIVAPGYVDIQINGAFGVDWYLKPA